MLNSCEYELYVKCKKATKWRIYKSDKLRTRTEFVSLNKNSENV